MQKQPNRLQRVSYWLYGSAALFAIFVLVAWSTLNTVKVNGSLHQTMRVYEDLTKEIANPRLNIAGARQHVLNVQLATLGHANRPVADYDTELRKARQEFEEAYQRWMKKLPAGAIRDKHLQEVYATGKQWFEIYEKEMRPAALRGDAKTVGLIRNQQMARAFHRHEDAVARMLAVLKEQVNETEQQAVGIVAVRTGVLTITGLIVLGIMLYVAFGVLRNVLTSTHRLQQVAQQLAA
ncbi:MAG: hypothetical protein ACUVR1_04105, partial [Fimbriimonadales bacterium]